MELSYLTRQEQRDLLETMESEDCTPSLTQAIQLKQASLQKTLNMDMIFAILCEELGLVGAAVALGLFAALIGRGTYISLRTDIAYERLLGLGICIKCAVQVLLNVAVVTNTIPNTGISLPFFSYGGSSLIMMFFEMGILLSISRRSRIGK